MLGRLRRFLTPEMIGPPACPILKRWTLYDRGWKVMLHRFPPDTEDRPLHDHPWTFFTIVLWGRYEDIGATGSEWVAAPTLRYRPARHMHRTKTDGKGAWTLVLAMPKSREWGFWHEGEWWPFKLYEQVFGFRDRCD